MLDTGALRDQLKAIADTLKQRQAQRDDATVAACADARAAASTWDSDRLRLCHAESSWLVAHSDTPPATTFASPIPPESYFVLAADGSQLAADRHDGFEECLLLQIGQVRIDYGNARRALLQRHVALLLRDDDTEGFGEDQIATRRYEHEMRALADMIRTTRGDTDPGIAMVDGSLIAWHLDLERDRTGAAADALEALLDALEAGRRLAVPVVGYISQPGSRDVVNALRVRRCPEQPRNCSQPKGSCECAPLASTTDAALFAHLLQPGERSAVFSAHGQDMGYSHILPRYGDHWIHFFYFHADSEIARIELPEWAALRPDLVDRIHSVCAEQARKGRGFPVAVAEAHEQAVLRPADREAFLYALTRAVIAAGGNPQPSRKANAKRTRSL